MSGRHEIDLFRDRVLLNYACVHVQWNSVCRVNRSYILSVLLTGKCCNLTSVCCVIRPQVLHLQVDWVENVHFGSCVSLRQINVLWCLRPPPKLAHPSTKRGLPVSVPQSSFSSSSSVNIGYICLGQLVVLFYIFYVGIADRISSETAFVSHKQWDQYYSIFTVERTLCRNYHKMCSAPQDEKTSH